MQIISSVIAVGAFMWLLPETTSYARYTGESAIGLQLTFLGASLLYLFVIVCSIAIWTWRIWGYWGLIIAYVLSIIVAVVGQQPSQIFGSLIWFGFFFMLTKDKTHLMDWKL